MLTVAYCCWKNAVGNSHMLLRQIGKDGPMVTAIGLGCWSFGGAYGETDESTSHKTLAAALDLGVDHLDTANVYGMGISESFIGSFNRANPNRFHIASKVGIYRDPETQQRGFNNEANYIRSELEKSLSRLHTDCIDLYYVHRRQADRPIEEVMETLLQFKQEGKIKGIGFSEISPASLRRACKIGQVDAVQSEYSLWSRMPELGLIRACKELNVAFVAFSPLGRGMFTSHFPDPKSFPRSDFRFGTPRFTEPNFSYNVQSISAFKAYALDTGTTPAALALAWCLAQTDHLIPIPGTRSEKHLRENMQALTLTLNDRDLAEIDRILPTGFAHGDRYSATQLLGAERYC